jgi:Domain of unknown function (DUF305)
MTAERQSLRFTDTQQSNITSFLKTSLRQASDLVRGRAPLVALGAAAICLLTVTAASLLVADRGAQATGGLCTTTFFGNTSEAAFLAENAAAMKKMMNDMHVRPTGNVDLDFVAMMVPHHQGAIDMAMAMLRHGGNLRLKRMAQEIIITQRQEIAAMHLAVGRQISFAAPQASQLSSARHEAR